jgi:hypothetical protein
MFQVSATQASLKDTTIDIGLSQVLQIDFRSDGKLGQIDIVKLATA